MPITWLTMLIGNLSLIWYAVLLRLLSKDSIIEAAKYSTLPGSGFAYFAVLASVFVTAFYAFRQYFMVFHGEEKWRNLPEHHDDHHWRRTSRLGQKRQSARKPAGRYLAADSACHSVRHHRLCCHRAYALRRFLQRRDFRQCRRASNHAHHEGRVPRRIGNGVTQPAFACTLPCYRRRVERMALVRQTAAPACENCTGVPSGLRFV